MKKDEFEAIFAPHGKAFDSGAIEDHLSVIATSEKLPDVSIGICLARHEESAPPLRALLVRTADGERLSEGEERLLFRGLHILGGAR